MRTVNRAFFKKLKLIACAPLDGQSALHAAIVDALLAKRLSDRIGAMKQPSSVGYRNRINLRITCRGGPGKWNLTPAGFLMEGIYTN